MFLFGAFPGQTKVMWSFFGGMFKAIATFVLVYVLFLVIYYLEYGNPFVSTSITPPPLVGITNVAGVVGSFLAIGLFVITPKLISDMTKFLGSDFSGYSTEFQQNMQSPLGNIRSWYQGAKKAVGSAH
jgi:hypothetical protein